MFNYTTKVKLDEAEDVITNVVEIETDDQKVYQGLLRDLEKVKKLVGIKSALVEKNDNNDIVDGLYRDGEFLLPYSTVDELLTDRSGLFNHKGEKIASLEAVLRGIFPEDEEDE